MIALTRLARETVLKGVFVLLVTLVLPVVATGQEQPTAPIELVQNAEPFLQLASRREVSMTDLALVTIPLRSDELRELATVWQIHLRKSLGEAVTLKLALESSTDAKRTEILSRLDEQAVEQTALTDKYGFILNQWQHKGASEEELKEHEDYLLALSSEAFRASDEVTIIRLGLRWVLSWDGGISILVTLIGVLLAMWGVVILAKLVRRTTARALKGVDRPSIVLNSFLLSVAYWVTLFIGGVFALAWFGVNVTALFALFGGLSLIAGLALQQTVSNIASGLLIIVTKPFDVGDYVRIGDFEGTVDRVTIISTTLTSADNQQIVLANSVVWLGAVVNVNALGRRRVDLMFRVDYSSKIPALISALKAVVVNHPLCLKHQAPEIFVGQLTDNEVSIFCRPWVSSENYWKVYWDLTDHARTIFLEEGVVMPKSRQDITLNVEGKAPAATQGVL